MALITRTVAVEIDPHWTFAEALDAALTQVPNSPLVFLRKWGDVLGSPEAGWRVAIYFAETESDSYALGTTLGCTRETVDRFRRYLRNLPEAPTPQLQGHRDSWATRIPATAPLQIRSASLRVQAAKEIETIAVELAAAEFRGIERGLIDELVLPGLQTVVRALRLNEELVTRWSGQRRQWASSMDDVTKAKTVFEYSSQTASIVAGIDAFINIVIRLLK